MQFAEGSFYHIYNRGNDKQPIFFQERNYDFFLQKVEKYILPQSDLIAWCLMPNHFHFWIRANAHSISLVKEKPIPINALTEAIRLLLSSYTKAIQKQESMVGNLFQQKTKFKMVDDYTTTAFHYIHQNPMTAGLVTKMEDWKWSSLPEYLKKTNSNMCNSRVAQEHILLNWESLLEESYSVIQQEAMTKIL